MTDKVEKILDILRAGVDPDTKQPHITIKEAKALLDHAYGKEFIKVLPALKTAPNVNQKELSDFLQSKPELLEVLRVQGFNDAIDLSTQAITEMRQRAK